MQFEAPNIAKFDTFKFLLTVQDDYGNTFSDTVKIKILPTEIAKERNEARVGVTGQESNTVSQKSGNSNPIIDSSSTNDQGDMAQISSQLKSPGIVITGERDSNPFQRETESDQLTKSKFTLPLGGGASKLKKIQGIPINDQYIVVLKDGIL